MITTASRLDATDAQLRFLLSLDTEYRDIQARIYDIGGETRRAAAIRGVDLAELRKGITKREASNLIDRMKDQVAVIKKMIAVLEPVEAKQVVSKVELEDGIYLLDAHIIKIRHAVHGNGNQYARGLDLNDLTPGGKPRFSKYIAGAMSKLTAEHKMSKAQAVEFGQLYGMCVNCGATLTDETSIERAMGPICAGKFS